ncbi:MAG: alginate O-acetyltransferase complex protein AlgI [Blastocatellia bacterium]|nr:alginate O-acetyltransferase complex protein AlgI [Blastocatellia bacterium]
MVFSDPVFIVGFLPAALIIFHLLRVAANGTAATASLVGLSMVFYAYWSVPFLFLLLGQIGMNYLLALGIEQRRSRGLFWLAVLFNLCLLGYFKYRNFFLENFEAVSGLHFQLSHLVVPLAISFHTFQQIALLADVKDDEVKVPPLLNYVFFVIFFPQLIAGPIVLHREMGKQVALTRDGNGLGLSMFAPGLFLFAFGLFKKICLADNIATFADMAFTPHQLLSMPEAWAGAISYALQLYFDFSGYSDMAVGLGLMFGFRLPFNFLIPYASPSMIEYWKRWHITMTRFFTMYTYMPVALAATRTAMTRGYGPLRFFLLATLIPTILTFLLSGLWHGAGWTFIMFGLVNGIGLGINHAWKAAKLGHVPRLVGWALTMVTILVTLVYFRSTSIAQANAILGSMFIPANLLTVPAWVLTYLPWPVLRDHVGSFTLFAEASTTAHMIGWIILLGPLSLLLPPLSAQPDRLQPTWRMGFAMASMAWLVLGFIDQPRSFLYFAF